MEPLDLELYIQIRDGQPYEHPIFADNFRAAFPEVDTNNLPPDRFAKFIRYSRPVLSPLQVHEGTTYVWDGDVVRDVHHVRDLEGEEREAKLEVLRREAINTHIMRLTFINNKLKEELTDHERALWQNCLAAHDLWTLKSPYPLSPPFPRMPIKNEDGIWVAAPGA